MHQLPDLIKPRLAWEIAKEGDHATPCKKQCNPANGCNHKECPYQDMFWVL
jgi:hypothetical protein